jgi:hypothetical protein
MRYFIYTASILRELIWSGSGLHKMGRIPYQPVEKVFIMQQSRGLMELFIEANNIIRKPKSLLKSIIDTIEQSDMIENRGKPS